MFAACDQKIPVGSREEGDTHGEALQRYSRDAACAKRAIQPPRRGEVLDEDVRRFEWVYLVSRGEREQHAFISLGSQPDGLGFRRQRDVSVMTKARVALARGEDASDRALLDGFVIIGGGNDASCELKDSSPPISLPFSE
jgi:formamidopyrimidine-DNA glycosylase